MKTKQSVIIIGWAVLVLCMSYSIVRAGTGASVQAEVSPADETKISQLIEFQKAFDGSHIKMRSIYEQQLRAWQNLIQIKGDFIAYSKDIASKSGLEKSHILKDVEERYKRAQNYFTSFDENKPQMMSLKKQAIQSHAQGKLLWEGMTDDQQNRMSKQVLKWIKFPSQVEVWAKVYSENIEEWKTTYLHPISLNFKTISEQCKSD